MGGNLAKKIKQWLRPQAPNSLSGPLKQWF
jgi:hypothetical protein